MASDRPGHAPLTPGGNQEWHRKIATGVNWLLEQGGSRFMAFDALLIDFAALELAVDALDTTTSGHNGRLGAIESALLAPCLVAALPVAPAQGTRGFVTDASATTFASTVAGGGANAVPVVFDGTNWIIG